MKNTFMKRPPVKSLGWLFYAFRKSLLPVLLLIFSDLAAQKYLVLEKVGTRKRFEYPVGSTLAFRLKGEDFFRTGTITDLVDSVIVLDYTFFKLNAIDAINIKGRPTSRVNKSPYAITLIAAGAVLFLGDMFNETVTSGNNYTLNNSITIASGSMIGAGLIWMFVRHDVRRLKRNWRLRVVDI